MKRIFEVDPWTITSHELNPDDKRLQESITSLGNEYMGMRGMFEETYSGDFMQGIYIGGVWYPDKTRVGWWKNGYPLYFGKAINAVNFAKVQIFVDSTEVDLNQVKPTNYEVSLDMQNGILTRTFTVSGVTFKVTRLISSDIKELAYFKWDVVSSDGQTHKVSIVSYVDADVTNEDSNYDEKFWDVIQKENGDFSYVSTKTIENPFGVTQFDVLASQSFAGDFEQGELLNSEFSVGQVWNAEVGTDVKTFEKRVIVTTSRDYDGIDAILEANKKLQEQVSQLSAEQIIENHSKVWNERWEIADVKIEGDATAQQGIRFNIFQLFSTYYGNDSRLNVGPKGFTGEKYGGATYWDTEAFIVPMYLSVAKPEVVRNLLKYRYDQLKGAYHNAQQQNLAGALYPMVTFDGIESHNEWEITFEEIHRNGTIAYALYNYTRYTGDHSWVNQEGSEVLIGIARFWADRVHYSARNDKYMMHGVTGPNEYENNVNNNWYTNLMAKWTLQYALEVLPDIESEYADKLNVTAEEASRWQEIIDKFYFPEADVDGKHIFVQHDTFLDKDLTPVSELPESARPLNQNWSWDRILRSPYIKQADVLQGIYYFMENYTQEEKQNNFNFYEPLTVHESSLSPSIHSILAADLGMEEKAVEMYARTARLDLDNYNNDTDDGLHITSMSGSWLAIVQGFSGMRVSNNGQLSFKPFLPKDWTQYSFRINFRDRVLEITTNGSGTKVTRVSGEPLEISIQGTATTV
ncbi:MAG: glycoside hydrolase family 65 protein [Lactobacillaceae bacterium]|jgi:maltose phosphorylase|nr:glycoside hydrolase family 65 protein [Lactobacillaceae bacterium]